MFPKMEQDQHQDAALEKERVTAMSYDLHMIKTSDFIRLDGQGKPDMIESRRALERVAKACIDRGCSCMLLDVRNVYSNLRASDLYHLVTAFPEIGLTADHRVAVLHRYVGGERAEFFATLAWARGWNVRAFDDYEEAIDWFSAPSPLS
jgi:hypothetical protein